MIALAMTAMTFTSCEDVPAPYDYPGTGGNEGGGELAEGVYLDQNFSTSLGDFQSVGSNPNIAWAIDYSSACITGYKDYNGDGTNSNEAGVTYLVSPEIDLTAATKAHVEMNHAMRYERSDINTNNSLLICKDYADDPTTANWVAIPYSTDGINGTSFDFVDVSANIPDEFIGSKVRLALRHTCSDSQSSTWEVKSLSVKEGEAENTGGGNEGGEEGVATGNGTLESPFNSVAANNYASNLASGEESPEVYIKGKVVSIKEQFGTQYGNATFYISDDGTTAGQFYVFRALYLGNVKYTSGDLLKEGDEVVICGKVTNYLGNTPETVQGSAYLYSLNGKTAAGGGETGGETGKATGDGTEANPFNSVAANNYASSLAAGAESDKDVYIKGKVVSVKEQYGTQYGNATFYISDDGTTTGQFYVFRALYLNNEKYTSGDLLQPGDEVVICGKVTNYMGNTPETVQGKAYLVSLKSNGGGGNEGGEEVPVGDGMTIAHLPGITTNSYGTQNVSDEATWFSWTYDNISYKGAKVCAANGDFSGCIQVQGNASDAAKQGFLFNETAFSKEIKSIVLVVKGKNTYDTPTVFSVYGGTEAHPTKTAITASTQTVNGDPLNTFTMTYDFSAGSYKYFTIWNNAVGALYIEKVVVNLK